MRSMRAGGWLVLSFIGCAPAGDATLVLTADPGSVRGNGEVAVVRVVATTPAGSSARAG